MKEIKSRSAAARSTGSKGQTATNSILVSATTGMYTPSINSYLVLAGSMPVAALEHEPKMNGALAPLPQGIAGGYELLPVGGERDSAICGA